MQTPRVRLVVLVLAGLLTGIATTRAGLPAPPTQEQELRALLARLDPPERLRELAGRSSWQAERGGGFLGLLPDFPADPDSIPVPRGAEGVEAAVTFLSAQRAASLAAIARVAPEYPLAHGGRPLPAWDPAAPPGWSLALDITVPSGFLDALRGGGVDADEAARLAALPANRAMLAHRSALAYLPPPRPDAADVAALMRSVASDDPLDRIWAWLNPWNGFGYADLVQHAGAYGDELAALAGRGDGLTAEALRRVAALAPEDVVFTDRFALTVGWGIRGWATPELGGLNLEHVKDDWDLLLGTLTEETFHRLQLQIVPAADGGRAATYEALAEAATGDPALDALHGIVTYTVLEGTANLARGDLAPARVRSEGPAGAALLARFVAEVVEGGDLAAADGLVNEGLRNNGPLYALGHALAARIAAAEGPRAVGAHLRAGPVAFALAAARHDPDGALLGPPVRAALARLRDALAAPSASGSG